MKTISKKVESWWGLYDQGSCPKCGYYLIKFSLFAECARCDFKITKEEYIKHYPVLLLSLTNQSLMGEKKDKSK